MNADTLLFVVEESTSMLDSESRYLPVLSEPSSGPSSPQVYRDDGTRSGVSNMAKPRRIVANFGCQSVTVQHSDAIVHPTKSTSHPVSHVHSYSQSPVARTLHLESSDILEPAVDNSAEMSSNRGTELVQQYGEVKQNSSDWPQNENGTAAMSSQYRLEKDNNTVQHIASSDSEEGRTKQPFSDSSVTNYRAEQHSCLVLDDKSLAVDIVSGHKHDSHGKSIFSSSQ